MADAINSQSILSRPIRPFEAPASDIERHNPTAAGQESSDKPSFRDILGNTIQQVNVRQQEADKAIEALATGKADNLAEVMSAVEKADLAFRTLMQFRNKLVSAYQEINNMRY
ncbi:MAG: flagellar hook-basal body complex protein FliE [Planctomycetes bacterium]|nr:flagellar hook-basal body complex protein FliE [Planctomycetota bacterium]